MRGDKRCQPEMDNTMDCFTGTPQPSCGISFVQDMSAHHASNDYGPCAFPDRSEARAYIVKHGKTRYVHRKVP